MQIYRICQAILQWENANFSDGVTSTTKVLFYKILIICANCNSDHGSLNMNPSNAKAAVAVRADIKACSLQSSRAAGGYATKIPDWQEYPQSQY